LAGHRSTLSLLFRLPRIRRRDVDMRVPPTRTGRRKCRSLHTNILAAACSELRETSRTRRLTSVQNCGCQVTRAVDLSQSRPLFLRTLLILPPTQSDDRSILSVKCSRQIFDVPRYLAS
jgi:hypothetical protein